MYARISTTADVGKLTAYLAALKLDGKRSYDVTVNVHRAKRSCPQNRLMWMWIGLIASELGYTKDELNTVFKSMWCPRKTVTVAGKATEIPVSTSELDSKQFTTYLDTLKQYALDELHILLPSPGDFGWEAFVDQYGRE